MDLNEKLLLLVGEALREGWKVQVQGHRITAYEGNITATVEINEDESLLWQAQAASPGFNQHGQYTVEMMAAHVARCELVRQWMRRALDLLNDGPSLSEPSDLVQ
jgi:hypothetical protein